MPALPAAPFAYPILDAGRLGPRSLVDVVAACAGAGVRLVQLRAKRLADRPLLALAEEAREATRRHGVLLIIDDRADVAKLVGADGVHVGQHDLPPAAVRHVLGPEAIVGFSTHDPAQLREALWEPIDYVAYGPVFATRSKEEPDPAVGLEGVREARRLLAARRAEGGRNLPLVVIGGLTRARAGAAVAAGADGVAVISDLLEAPDLAAACRELQAVLSAVAAP